MTLKQHGGVFGRNPTFNDVTVDGTLTSTRLDVNSTGKAAALFQGYTSVTGTNSASNGEILLGNTPSFQGRISYEGQVNGHLFIDNSWENANAHIIFRQQTAGSAVELGRFNSNGLAFPSGKGIDFSATSGTGTSELFDDYEEGTYTVQIYDAASGGNASPTTATGYYTKVGRLVTVNMRVDNIDTTGMTAGNPIAITVPFVASDSQHVGSAVLDNVTFTGSYVVPILGVSAIRFNLRQITSAAGDANLNVSSINSGVSDIAGLTLTYFA